MKPKRARRYRYRLKISSWQDVLLIGVPAVLLVVAGFWLAAQFVQPAPPHQLILSSGSEGGGYQRFAARYRELLARNGIELVERPSAGALGNLQRLRDPAELLDAAFVQGGTASVSEEDRQRLVSLGGLYAEPVWIFYRTALAQRMPGKSLDQISQLRGRRIAIGAPGSGTHKLAMDLLGTNGMAQDDGRTSLRTLDGLAVVEALRQGQVDAAFVVGPLHSAVVWTLLYDETVRPMSLSHAAAYTRLYPPLQQLSLPRGAIDMIRDIPHQEMTLLAPMATLVVRVGTHPALIDLLLQAATEVHGEPGIFQKPHEFPRAMAVDFPLAEEAERYYRAGKTFLQRYLPFWLATLVDRMLVLLVPLLALLLPIARFAPMLYGWRIRARIFRRYGELKFLEAELELDACRHSQGEWLARLDEIEADVYHLPTPLAFSDMLYTLRGHIGLVRAAILRKT